MTNYRTKKGKELLAHRIEEYFLMCDRINNSPEKNEKDKGKPKKPYTLTGLLFHLDMSAKELDELSKNRGLGKIIAGAKRRIEAYIEENCLTGNLSATAAFNSLKEHFGWSTKNEEHESEAFSLELCEEAEILGA